MKAIIPFLFTLTLSASAFGQTPWPTPQWAAASPTRLGLNKDALAALDRALASGRYGHIDGLLVIRHGKVGYEKAYHHDYSAIYQKDVAQKSALNSSDPGGPYNYFNPWWHPYYHATDLHTLQSVTKTVTSAIIGVALARHEFPDLDTPVLRFFDTTAVKNMDGRKRRMTLRHLLTMTAGLAWNEDTVPYADPANDGSVMEASHDWVKYVLDKPMAAEPGNVFNYNGGARKSWRTSFGWPPATTWKNTERSTCSTRWGFAGTTGNGRRPGWSMPKGGCTWRKKTLRKSVTST